MSKREPKTASTISPRPNILWRLFVLTGLPTMAVLSINDDAWARWEDTVGDAVPRERIRGAGDRNRSGARDRVGVRVSLGPTVWRPEAGSVGACHTRVRISRTRSIAEGQAGCGGVIGRRAAVIDGRATPEHRPGADRPGRPSTRPVRPFPPPNGSRGYDFRSPTSRSNSRRCLNDGQAVATIFRRLAHNPGQAPRSTVTST